ncbi:PAS domain-containing sensor histidine kinase [Borborobacter arsenicus]|uniref:PAS domain-containing sensor histidine kinase n=1 Tax=Borborobacter arsenicus TaxID=1851146 RepID=UPI00315D6C13
MADEAERERQRHLIGMLLASPFLMGAATALFLPALLGASMTLAFICGLFSLAWLFVLQISSSGSDRIAAPLALALGTVFVAMIVASAGGFVSPVSVMIAALPLEAYLRERTSRSLLVGGAAALAVLPLQALLGSILFAQIGPVAGWHWVLPIAYGMTLLPRIGGLIGQARPTQPDQRPTALEDMIEAVVVRMTPNGEVADVSAQARSMLRIAPELMLGSGLFDRIHISDRVAYLCALADLREGAARRKVELRLRLPRMQDDQPNDNYRPFCIELMSSGLPGQAFVALIRDNDEAVQLREALVASAEATEALELAKGRFLAAVSHELRTPLNAIIGFSDMLLLEMFGSFGDPRQKEYVALVRDSGRHLLEVVNSILDVSKIESGAYATNPEPFQFVEAVRMCEQMMSLQAENKAISLTTQIAPEAGEIQADKRAVQQMLINLVSNAIKFTPKGGSVALGAKRIGSRLHFWVSDTGIGIAEDDLCRLGKPFTQVQNDYTRQFEGTGLGLALVKGLVSLHEGTMSIESALGEGTTVTITLPVAGPTSQKGCEKGALLPMPPAKRKEDNNGALRKAG